MKFLKEFLFPVACILALVLVFLFSIRKLAGIGDFDAKRETACIEYGEMVGLPSKSNRHNCYVEFAPGQWVDQTYYDTRQLEKYLRIEAERLTSDQ